MLDHERAQIVASHAVQEVGRRGQIDVQIGIGREHVPQVVQLLVGEAQPQHVGVDCERRSKNGALGG